VQNCNKRILKNTIALYFRQIFVLVVTLYTSRVILAALGVEDFGIYGVVGGVVSLFSLFTDSMTLAAQRFFSFAIGKKDDVLLSKYFSSTFFIYVISIITLFIFASLFGSFIVNEILNIPVEKKDVAIDVFHISIITIGFSLLSIPYTSIIIAHEKMNVYAYASIVDVLLRLLCAYGVSHFSAERLIDYAWLTCASSLIMFVVYFSYCRFHYNECKIRLNVQKTNFFELLSFGGWNLWGCTASVLKVQGSDILLNIFFGPSVNASRAIAARVSNAINSFSGSFFTAVKPPLVKAVALGKKEEMMMLLDRSARFSFFLVYLFVLPIIVETDEILSLWLKIVPEHAAIFSKLMLIECLVETFVRPLNVSVVAIGNIRRSQITSSILRMAVLPIGFFAFKLGATAETIFYVAILSTFLVFINYAQNLRRLTNFSPYQYTRNLFFKIIPAAVPASLFAVLLQSEMAPGTLRLLLCSFGSFSINVFCFGLFATTKNEKEKLKALFLSKLGIT